MTVTLPALSSSSEPSATLWIASTPRVGPSSPIGSLSRLFAGRLALPRVLHGAQPGRRFRMRTPAEEGPGRRRRLGESFRAAPKTRETRRGRAAQGSGRVWRTVENGNGERPEQRRPAPPGGHLQQAVGAGEPHESRLRATAPQRADRVHRIARPQRRLQGAGVQAPVPRGAARRGQTLLQRRHPATRLQRVLRRHQPPHPVELEFAQRPQADAPMSVMRRIERPAEQPDTRPPPEAREEPGEAGPANGAPASGGGRVIACCQHTVMAGGIAPQNRSYRRTQGQRRKG